MTFLFIKIFPSKKKINDNIESLKKEIEQIGLIDRQEKLKFFEKNGYIIDYIDFKKIFNDNPNSLLSYQDILSIYQEEEDPDTYLIALKMTDAGLFDNTKEIQKYLLKPTHDIVEEHIEHEVDFFVNFKFVFVLIFSLIAPLTLLIYSLFTIIQLQLLPNSNFIFIAEPLMKIFVLFIFSFSVDGLILTRIFSLRFYKKRLGDKFGELVFYSNGFGILLNKKPISEELYIEKRKKLGKNSLMVLGVLGAILLIFVIMTFNFYITIGEDGIENNEFFSLEPSHYNWNDIKNVYIEYGRILRDNKHYHPYGSQNLVLITKDNSKIDFIYLIETNGNYQKTTSFILEKTNLNVEEVIWNTSNNEYIPYSEELINNYLIDNG